jgi:hypothetical protein
VHLNVWQGEASKQLAHARELVLQLRVVLLREHGARAGS